MVLSTGYLSLDSGILITALFCARFMLQIVTAIKQRKLFNQPKWCENAINMRTPIDDYAILVPGNGKSLTDVPYAFRVTTIGDSSHLCHTLLMK